MTTLADYQHRARLLCPDVNADLLDNLITDVWHAGVEWCIFDLCTRPIQSEEEETDFNCANL